VKDLLNGWGATAVVFLPLVGVAAMLLIPKSEETLHKVVALVTSLVVLAVGVALLFEFDYGSTGDMQFRVDSAWIELINSRYIVGIDGISLPLIALTVFVVPLVIVYSWDHFPEPRNPKAFLILILILETGMVGSFVAQDLLLFFVFFELVLLPMYFMIGVYGGEARKYASLKFFLYTAFGSALMIVAILATYFLGPEVGGQQTFSI
jgi:NADH-quinone oxidoreductase subunit M